MTDDRLAAFVGAEQIEVRHDFVRDWPLTLRLMIEGGALGIWFVALFSFCARWDTTLTVFRCRDGVERGLQFSWPWELLEAYAFPEKEELWSWLHEIRGSE